MQNRSMSRVLAAGVVAACLVGTVSCGYALAGRGNALPATIKTIGVPQFVNHSRIADVDRVLTDAVREEFQTKGRYQVRPDNGGVDGLLTCTITSAEPTPTAFTADRRPSAYAIVVIANVEFKDLNDSSKVLWANPSFRVTDDTQILVSGDVDINAVANQNPQAMERLAKKFAKEVVTSIFEAF